MHVLKPIHVTVGVFGLIVFVLTGQYMAIVLHGLTVPPDTTRLLYRSSHLYLMWAVLLNLVVGLHFVSAATRGARVVQVISSVLLLAAPALILTSFITESSLGKLDRTFSDLGNYAALGGAVLHVAANLKSGRNKSIAANIPPTSNAS